MSEGARANGERAEAIAGVADVDLDGATVLVTGSTDGIGREMALALGRLGATVLVHGRDREKGRAVVDRIDDSRGESMLYLADFAAQSEVRELAEAVAEHAPLDALVNNAGGYFHRPRLTPEGFEYAFGVNHLAPFLLTNLLRTQLSPDARVVTTASGAHRGADGIDFEAVQTVEGYSPMAAYSRSKLANVLFAAELARKLRGGVSYSFHPGFVPGSSFPREVPRPIRWGMQAIEYLPDVLSSRITNTVVEGAATGVYLVAAPDVDGGTGDYFEDCAPTAPSRVARDRDLAERLWNRSLQWTGLDEGGPA